MTGLSGRRAALESKRSDNLTYPSHGANDDGYAPTSVSSVEADRRTVLCNTG